VVLVEVAPRPPGAESAASDVATAMSEVRSSVEAMTFDDTFDVKRPPASADPPDPVGPAPGSSSPPTGVAGAGMWPLPDEAWFDSDPSGLGPDEDQWWDMVAASEFVPEPPDELEVVRGLSTLLASYAADRFRAVHALCVEWREDAARHGRGLTDVVDRALRLELAAGLGITEHAAADLMTLAEAVVATFPSVGESLSKARITEQHARVFVSLMSPLEPAISAGLAKEALALAEAHPVGVFRRLLRALIDRTRVQTVPERFHAALQERRVYTESGADGMAWLHLYAPEVEVHAVLGRITRTGKAVRKSVPGDPRSLDQVRADVALDLLIDGDTTVLPVAARGIRPQVVVTVPVLSLLDDRSATAGDPAVVEGVGPIPIARARELCGSASSWMRVLTHPETGMVLSVGRDSYEPPAALRRLVMWRADRCVAPGCSMPASRCDVDHTIAFSDGGETSIGNLAPICRGHHMVKHHGGWSVTQHAGGVIEWVSPSGRSYLVEPERRVPTFRPEPEPEEVTPAPF
jgi:hypothetical protein